VSVGLHRADFVHRLVHVGRDVRDAVLVVARQAPYAAPEQQDRHQRGRDSQQHAGRELPADDEHHHRRTQHHQQVAHEHRQAVADHLLHQRGVVGEAGNDLAGARGLEVGRLQREEMVEHRAPQVGDHAFAQAHHQVEAHEGRRRQQGCNADNRRQRLVQQFRISAAEAPVHHVLQALAHRQHAARGHKQGEHRHCDFQAIGRNETRQAQGMPHRCTLLWVPA
jgi:hypothetical protein